MLSIGPRLGEGASVASSEAAEGASFGEAGAGAERKYSGFSLLLRRGGVLGAGAGGSVKELSRFKPWGRNGAGGAAVRAEGASAAWGALLLLEADGAVLAAVTVTSLRLFDDSTRRKDLGNGLAKKRILREAVRPSLGVFVVVLLLLAGGVASVAGAGTSSAGDSGTREGEMA